jgi:hypothetical protein
MHRGTISLYVLHFPSEYPLTPSLVAGRAVDKDTSPSLLPLQQMIENDYPMPSCMADVFDKQDGCVDKPQPVS